MATEPEPLNVAEQGVGVPLGEGAGQAAASWRP